MRMLNMAVAGDKSDRLRLTVARSVVEAELVERDAWLDFFKAAPPTVREEFSLSEAEIGGMGLIASPTIPITELNRAMAVGVERAPLTGELDRVANWLDTHAAPDWALQIAPDAINAGLEGIDRHHLEPSGPGWAKFVQALPAPTAWTPASKADVTKADIPTSRSFGVTVQNGFGLPDASAAWFEALVGRPGWHCFIATMDGEPAGAAAMFVSHTAAWSGMSATLPSCRGQGVQSSLIAARLNAAVELGVTVFTSETGRPAKDDEAGFSSFRNQKRAGSTEVYVRSNFKRTSG